MTFFSRKNTKFIFTVVLLLIIIFISSRGADNPVKGLVLTLASPFLKTFRIFSGGGAGFFDFLGSIGNLKSENEKLVKKNQELLAENVRLEDISEENKQLRKELDLLPRKKFDLEASFVIAQDPREAGAVSFLTKEAGRVFWKECRSLSPMEFWWEKFRKFFPQWPKRF